MAFQTVFRKNRPVYMIIKDYVIRYVEVKQTNPLVIQRYGERYLPDGLMKEGKIVDADTLSLILEECIDQWKLRKRKIYFHAPDAFVVIRKVNIPDDLHEDEIYGYLYMEIGTSIHLPFDEPVFDYAMINNEKGNKEIILFVLPEEIIEAYTNVFEVGKLIPALADISSLSLYRLYHQFIDQNKSGQLMIVQFDLQAVNVCIFENQFPVFMRHIPMELDLKQWNLSMEFDERFEPSYAGDQKDVSNALKDMYKEIARVIDFYRYTLNQGNQQVTKLYLSGDHPWMTEIETELRRRIPIPIETITADTIRTVANNMPLPTAFHSVAGLGLKGV